MASSGVYRETNFPDELSNASEKNISKAFDSIAARANILSAPVVFVSTPGIVSAGTSVVFWAGTPDSTAKLTLPLAAAQGRNVSSIVLVSNSTAGTLTVMGSARELISGATTFAVLANSVSVFASDGISAWQVMGKAAVAASPSGLLLRMTVLTGTSLASIAGCKLAIARLRAASGGGGGARSGGIVGTGGGGAVGGFAEMRTTAIPATWNYTLGAAGTAGAATPTDGGAGGNATFADAAITVTAFGGPGGKAGNGQNGPGGSAPAVSTNGTRNGSGSPGGAAVSGDVAISGAGGSSDTGGGGEALTAPGNGLAGTGIGAGGSGGFNNGGAGNTGGVGTAAEIVLWEYS